MNPVTNPEGFATGMTVITIVIVVVSILVTLIPTVLIIWFVYKRFAKNQAIVSQGEPAMAQVLSAQQTGTYINSQPEVAVGLTVQRQGQPPYQAQATAVLSMMDIPRVQPGMQIPVKVNPGNPLEVALDLNRPMMAPMAMMPGAAPMGGAVGNKTCPYCQNVFPATSPMCTRCGSPVT